MEGFGDDEFGDEPEIEPDTAPEAAAPVYLTEQENSEALDAVRRVAEEFRFPELSIWVAGSPVVTLMDALGVHIKVSTQILPSFFLAVGVGTSVHILSIFFYRCRRSGDKEDAEAYALGHSGMAVVMMTNVTTAAGSFST